MRKLEQYHWPGNVRELRNVIERATILAEGEFIERSICRRSASCPWRLRGSGMTLEPGITVEEAERRLIVLTLEHTRDNKTRAAEILGISLKTLHNKLNRLGLQERRLIAGRRMIASRAALGPVLPDPLTCGCPFAPSRSSASPPWWARSWWCSA